MRPIFNTFIATTIAALVSVAWSAGAQITVQAESYKSLVNGSTPIVLENAGTTVGYFDEQGESISYSINIPSAGYYEVSLRYLAGAAGTISVVTASGAKGLLAFDALISDTWWTTPVGSWLTSANSSSPLFYFDSGAQTISIESNGTGVNLDFLQITKSTATNTTISSIVTDPARLEIMPGKKKQVKAYGVTSDGRTVAAPITWSANMPNGLFTASATAGVETGSVTIGALTKTIYIKIAMPTKKRDFVVTQFGNLNILESTAGAGDWALRGEARQKASLIGPSLFWSCSAPTWWKKETVQWLVDDWHIQVIRCPVSIGPGLWNNTAPFGSYNAVWNGTTWNSNNYYHNPEYATGMMDEVIAAAIENDIYVIIDFHEHHSQKFKTEAIAFFDYFSKKWGKYPNVLYEIFNEPFVNEQVNDGNYADDVCKTIRANDPDNVIIIGSKNYSRDPAYGASFYRHGNIAGTWHGYVENNHQADWSGNPSWGNGTAVVVTEWGRKGNDDGGMVQIFKNKGVMNCTWTLNNKQTNGDESWSAFNTGVTKSANWTDADLAAPGKWMREAMRGYGFVPGEIKDLDAVTLSLEKEKIITLPSTTFTPAASASTGFGTIQYTWKQLSGPSTANFSSTAVVSPTISALSVGVYQFKLSATNGVDVKEATVKVTVLPSNYVLPTGGDVIDNVEDNNTITLWGGNWSIFDDNSNKGASTITAAAALPNNKAILAAYTLDKGAWAYNPYCGVRVSLKADASTMDLSACSQITYKYKGAAHDFRAEMAKITDDDFHKKSIAAATNWTTVSINWSDLAQDPSWGVDVGTVDRTNIKNFSWQVSAASGSGTIEIDDLTCVGMSGPVSNMPPVAYCGNDISVNASNAALDGSASFDPKNDALSYAWSQISGATTATITGANTTKPQLSNLQTGNYLFRLLVSDASGSSADTVQVTVTQSLITQTISLAAGWNLVSINVCPTDSSIATLFKGIDVQEIKNMTGFWTKNQSAAFNSIQKIEPAKGYLVKMNTAGTIKVSGTPVVKTQDITSLQSNWHLIGCPYQTPTAISTLFNATNCAALKNFEGFWIPNNGLSSISTIEPSKAYFIKTK